MTEPKLAVVKDLSDNNASLLKAALQLFDHGICVIPVERGTKKPAAKFGDWTRLDLTRDQIKQIFSNPYNIGVHWGPASDWRIDIDLDTDEAVYAASFFFKKTYTYGRKKRPNSHLIYKCEGAETKKYPFSEGEGVMLLEIRSKGAQSVVPPSIHPDDDQYCIASPNYSTRTISLDELTKAAERTAVAALFARHWKGGRHAKTLALTGALLNAGWPDDDVATFVAAVVCAAKDEEAADRKRACGDTIKRYRIGTENVTGWPTVAEHFGDAITKKARAWLHITDGPRLNGATPLSVVDAIPWPEPQPVEAELLTVESLPVGIIPEPYRGWVADVSERMQTPPDFLATSAITVTASVIGTACTIKPKRYDDWQVVPNVWGGAIGRPTVLLKTPAMKEGLNPLSRLELNAKEAYEAAEREYKANLAMVEAERWAVKEKMKKAAKDERVTGDIAALKDSYCSLEPPDAPIWRRYKTNDATIEKCNELVRDNPRGLLLFRDELVGLLAGWEKPGHESDRAYFLEGWNGNQGHTDDRITRGTTFAENVCVSVYGGIQPTMLQTYLYQCMRGLQNDGLMQRLQLAVYPDEPRVEGVVDRRPDIEAKNRAYRIIKTLAEADFATYGAMTDSDTKFPYLHFADDAQELFYAWLTELQGKLRDDEDEPVILEHLGKYRSLMPSLALIFHLIDIADGTTVAAPVSLKGAELAAAWCDYLESHARRIYGLISNPTLHAAAELSKKIRAGKLPDGFTIRDVYRKDWRLLMEREAVQKACDELVARNWLREVVTPAAQGQKEKVVYLINPQVRKL